MSDPPTPRTGAPVPVCPGLTPRERETLRHIAAGRTYVQAARAMGLSPHTVDAYLRRIRAKLDAASTAELTRLAIALGL
ncbi:response regulator transcription factor [Streptomyces olivochromogenes]|uniref:response regulator transcription factor n=1 Tax=Streptomyces olivochromogenes TaxID=1963 RepID=UPI001F32D8A4|nr:helix-turn-helix domain-containing protein [Streptomyces olivochromogenes]MCF3136803.1 helix-turn-helix domain-containing protein [Streptomyces olivochromogenes]